MSLYQPDGPRPVVDDKNLTVQDLTTHLVRIANRAKMADEKMSRSEYNALLSLSEDYIKLIRRFQTSIRFARDKQDDPPIRGSVVKGLRRLSLPERSQHLPACSPMFPDLSSPSE